MSADLRELRRRILHAIGGRDPRRPYVRYLPAGRVWVVWLRTTPWTWAVLHHSPDRVAALDFAHQWAGFRDAMTDEPREVA